jgi:hypothetical protein
MKQGGHLPPPDFILHGFIYYREALIRLVRIKARFMRQCEQRFARYHNVAEFIKRGALLYRVFSSILLHRDLSR